MFAKPYWRYSRLSSFSGCWDIYSFFWSSRVNSCWWGWCSISQADIPHIRLRVSKEPAILHDGNGRGIHERRQLSHRAHKTISRCRELASARQRRRLSAVESQEVV